MAYVITKGKEYFTGSGWNEDKGKAKKYPSVAKASSQISYNDLLKAERGLRCIKESRNFEAVLEKIVAE